MSEENQLVLAFLGGGYVLLFLLWRDAAIFLFNAAIVCGVCLGFAILVLWLQDISPWLALIAMVGMIWVVYSSAGRWRGGRGFDEGDGGD